MLNWQVVRLQINFIRLSRQLKQQFGTLFTSYLLAQKSSLQFERIIYITKIQSLMKDGEQFNQSDHEQQIIVPVQHPKIHISVLKNIPAALAVMVGQSKAYEVYSPRYLFTDELTKTNQYIMPKNSDSTKIIANRLLSIQDAYFEHGKIKEHINDIYNKGEKECKNTLWEIYSEKQLYYNRFQPTIKKQNFANVFMSIANINLDSKSKSNLPSIKNKTGNQQNSSSVIFDSHFQSANLLYVYKNNQDKNVVETYDLILQNDTNTKGHNQWFYFKIINTKKNQRVKINIINLVKKQSLFSYGLKPLTFSQKNAKNGQLWIRNGQKISYEQSVIKRQDSNQSYYSLSFEYQFRQPFDSVYFAPSFPYTYSQLVNFMDSILIQKKYATFLSIKKLCETAGKNTINMITISSGKQSEKDCKIIWILARQHPFETTSSYMVENIITKLLDLMVKESQADSNFYQNYIFKIIPMVNPDGVIHGNSRAELTGIDPNRVWKKPSRETTPNIYYIKKQIIKDKKETCLILDLHSHSKKLGCFFYGNYEANDLKSYRILPSRICQNDIRFCYKNSRFRGGNENSARRALYEQLKIPNIYTVECSLLGYMKENRITQYKMEDYQEMGARIIDTFFEIEKQKQLQIQAEFQRYPDEGNDFFCDAQSARSDSSVSNSEYEQVYHFNLTKRRNNLSKKKKYCQNNFVETAQEKLLNKSAKKDRFVIKVVDNCKNQKSQAVFYKEKPTTNPRINEGSPNPNFKRQFSIKQNNHKSSAKNQKKIRDYRRAYRSIKEQLSTDKIINKTFGEKSSQLDHMKQSSKNIEPFTKTTDARLAMIDSAEDERKSVNKNKADFHITYSKQNLNTPQNGKKERSISNFRNFRHPYPLIQLNDTSKGQKLKREKRGVLMYRN